MARVIAVCRSEKKGTRKHNIGQGLLVANAGLVDDAHSDVTNHRQVSLLALESIRKMNAKGVELVPGDFAENITTEGIDLTSLQVGSRLVVGSEVILEITQVGKECHRGCAIFEQVGTCVMPREGVFAKVMRGGLVKEGDTIQVEVSVEQKAEE